LAEVRERLDTLTFIKRYLDSGKIAPRTSGQLLESASHNQAFQQACRDFGVEMSPLEEGKYEFRDIDGSGIGYLKGMRSSLTSPRAANFCKNTRRTTAKLLDSCVSAPRHGAFTLEQYQQALDYCIKQKFNVVVKPVAGRAGMGITTQISNEQRFARAWEYAARNVSPKLPEILVEDKVQGIDIRVTVVGDRFSCAVTRVPAHVVGDGQSSLKLLVAQKNLLREQCPFHRRHLIDLGRAIEYGSMDSSYREDSVPARGEVVMFYEAANVHLGGDACDVTHLLCPKIRETAIAAAQTVHMLGVASVDLMVDDFEQPSVCSVIEINTNGNFGVHLHLLYGTPRNPAIDILEEMKRRAIS